VDGKTLYATIHKLCAKYFLVSLVDFPIPLPNDQEFDSRFELLFANAATELYLIHDSPRTILVNRTNLLRNAGFDEVENGWPVAWRRFGNPVVGSPPGGAASNPIAAEVTDKDGLQQMVRIIPGDICELALQARATPPGRVFRLQVNWINRDGQICDVFIRVCAATDTWQRYSCTIPAPPCAELADVYASGQSEEGVWVDSFVFTQARTANR
jgi:hypothetical protein